MQEGAETRNSQSGIKVLPRVGTGDGADSQAEVIGDQNAHGQIPYPETGLSPRQGPPMGDWPPKTPEPNCKPPLRCEIP